MIKVKMNVILCCFVFVILIYSCVNKGEYNFNSKEKSLTAAVKTADSIKIVKTVRAYSRLNFYTFKDYSKTYNITNENVKVFVERIFYSPNGQALIAWIGEKMFNANLINNYSKGNKSNRICPAGNDTIYHFKVVIGYKNSENNWVLYPWGNRQVPCCNSVQEGLAELEKYYFHDIKYDYFETVCQENDRKGSIIHERYKYSILDQKFWLENRLWQKDTIGTNGLYPFEVKSYGGGLVDKCFKCADPFILPNIN